MRLAALVLSALVVFPSISNAAPATPPAVAEAVVGPPKVAWKDMSKEQKGKFMKAVVMPKMRELFQAYDIEEFAKFECKTCHGKDPKAVAFKMPSANIFVLPGTPEGFKAMAEKKPKWMKFMGGTVKPQMAALLGLPSFDPKKPEAGGFGCQGCHTNKTN